jgi:predicted nuclease with RNAse H fold
VSLALGVDVGVRKGCHAIALDADRSVVGRVHLSTPAALRSLLTEVRPAAVAIDSPPRWAPTGQRSRACERALLRLGIHAFFTPDAAHGEGHAFYRWMTVGFECYEIARRCGYETLEVFPHACAVTLLGACAPAGSPKRAWRITALERAGVPVDQLGGIDEIDAALAAVAGRAWLDGTASVVGHPAEGEIVLPVAELASRYPRPSRPTPPNDPERSAPSGRPNTR